MLTLRLTRLSYFNSLAYPSAMALIIVVAAALTVAPAILVVGSRRRAAGSQADDEDQGLAQGRHSDRAMAQADPRRRDQLSCCSASWP